MKKIFMFLLILTMFNVPCHASRPTREEVAINNWNRLMSMQDSAVYQGHYGMAEEMLNDAITDSLQIKSIDDHYFIESCIALANLLRYEGRYYDSVRVYMYLDSEIALSDKNYELKTEISIRINSLKGQLDREQQAQQYQQQQIIKQQQQERRAHEHYEGTFLLTVSDILTKTCSMSNTIRYAVHR